MKKQIAFSLSLICFFTSMYLNAVQWHVLLYMDSTDELSDMAIKNITDLLRVQSDDQVAIYIQLHAYDDSALRYVVTSKGLSFVQEKELTKSPKENLIHAADWAFAKKSADHCMFILWNHGWGILDPQYDESSGEWYVGLPQEVGACPIKRRYGLVAEHKRKHRGFMFSAMPRSYLSNQDMADALSHIKKNILDDKKIDIVAFDTCMGGMLEVAYQLEPYADYLVGSQVCSLRDGFDYVGIHSALNSNYKPHEMAQQMVHIFDTYYQKHDKNGIYAHTALDLSSTQLVLNALDVVVKEILSHIDGAKIALNAHKSTPRFCIYPMYTDAVAYIQCIEEQLSDVQENRSLLKAIHDFYRSVEQCVVARCAGFANAEKTHGCAIYVPMYAVDSSYYATRFAQQSQWIKLLNAVAGCAK